MHKRLHSIYILIIIISFAIAFLSKTALSADETSASSPSIQQPATQEPPPLPQPQASPSNQTPKPVIAPEKKTLGPRLGEISFNFDDADVYEVIQTVFGEILRANYLIDPKVKGRVNFRTVIPIPKDDILPIMEIILKQNSIGYVEEKGLYKIIPLNEVPGTAPKVFVYPLQNSKAKDVSSILQQIFLGAKPSPTAPRPATGRPATAPEPALPQTAALVTPGSEVLVAANTRIFPDEVTNSIVILATPDDYALIEETVKKIDIMPRQVMIEALVASIKLTDNLTLGLQWSLSTDISKINLKPFKNDINIGGNLGFQGLSPLTSGTFGYTAIDTAGRVRLLIEALAEKNKAKVLSSPHVLVSDNREARIQVGDQIPIATSTTTTPIGTGTTVANTTSSTIQYKDTGTILKVKPQINDSGLISLEISQEVSSADTTSVLGTLQYVISKREVTTNLVAQDGQTIVIGGLINEVTNKGRTGIPLLSDIPVLGYLFGRSTDNTTRTELVILLTPRVVRTLQESATVTSEYLKKFKGSTKHDIKLDEYIKQRDKQEKPAGTPDSKEPAKPVY